MQTIVRNGTNVSLYYLADSKTVDIGSDKTTISDGGTPELIIALIILYMRRIKSCQIKLLIYY